MHHFKKKFGQNFLRNIDSVTDLVQAAGITKTDNVLEIGPGEGSVTEFLLQKAGHVTSVEIDPDLIPKLKTRFKDRQNFSVLPADVLDLDLDTVYSAEPYKVVGSLPYNISKLIIKKFLTAIHAPVSMTVIVQKEVAEDYGTKYPKAAFLGNFATCYSDVTLGKMIDKSDFYPEPKVDGQIVSFKDIMPRFQDTERLVKFIKIGYSSPRKILSGNLANTGIKKTEVVKVLKKMELPETARASELSLEQWYNLQQSLIQHVK